MTEETPERISARSFSRTFEKMCNFIAVARTGDTQATIRGLITLCLLEFPSEHFDNPNDFQETIETLFGLAIPERQIQDALDELERTDIIGRPGNTNYRLNSSTMASLRQSIDQAQQLEERVKSTWFDELAFAHPNLSEDQAWKVLRAYLCRTFRRHGIQAAALLDPSIDTPVEHEASLSHILKDVIDENIALDKDNRNDIEKSISDFMASVGADSDRLRYIAQLADGAFNFYTLEVPADLSQQLRQQLHDMILFLDTNFLFGILDLHYNTQVQVSHDLIRAISEHGLPFELRYHEATARETSSTILHYGSILRSRVWTRSLSRAAASSRNLSGIEKKFHEKNATGQIDVQEFLRRYEHFDQLLFEKGIKIYRPHEERLDARNNLYHDYRKFLEEHGRGDKPYETVMHDAVVLEEARHRRTTAASSLEAGSLVISCDYFLYRFDWESSRKNGHRACVLMPNMFWQILRPFLPDDQDFEKAFVETFALPQFRAIGSGGSKACSKMLQILATYKDVPEQTAMKMLANDLLLDKLSGVENPVQFADQVEAAFVEENRNLIEEKAALEKELQQQKDRAEKEIRKRQEDNAKYIQERNRLNETLVDIKQQLDSASRAIKEHEGAVAEASRRAYVAEQSANDFKNVALEKEKAVKELDRKAFKISLTAGAILGILSVLVFELIVHLLPWAWLASHKNSIPLQIGISLMLICIAVGLLVKRYRKWCWSVGVVSLLLTLLTLMGN